MLKSFNTVFYNNEGLGNKLTNKNKKKTIKTTTTNKKKKKVKAPLLGLAKSIQFLNSIVAQTVESHFLFCSCSAIRNVLRIFPCPYGLMRPALKMSLFFKVVVVVGLEAGITTLFQWPLQNTQELLLVNCPTPPSRKKICTVG